MKDIIKQIIIVRKDLMTREKNAMGPGKLAAQVAHASLAPILEKMRGVSYDKYVPPGDNYTLSINMIKGDPLKEWLESDFRKIVLYVKSEEKLLQMHQTLNEAGIISSLIKDNGLTVFDEPTYTCIGIEPLPQSIIGPLTKRLRVL